MKTSFFSRMRTEKGLFVQEVAQKLGLPVEEVLRWEQGVLPDSKYLLPLAQLLGISVEEFLRGQMSQNAQNEIPDTPNEVLKTQSETSDTQNEMPVVQNAARIPREESTAAQTVAEAGKRDAGSAGEDEEGKRASGAAEGSGEGCFRPARGKKNGSGRADGVPEREGYYQKLNRKLAEKYPPGSIPPDENTIYRNGYTRGERIFGYLVGAVFLLVLCVQLFVWLGRERDITAENYRDFLDIRVEAAENFNADEYLVILTAKRDLLELSLSVEVRFVEISLVGTSPGEEIAERTEFRIGELGARESVSRTVHLDTYMVYERGFEVLSVSGRAA